MTEDSLSDLLERAAGRAPVGPAPLERIRHDASGIRRRRTTILVAAAALVVAGTAVIGLDRGNAPGQSTPTSSQSPKPTRPSGPAGAARTDLQGTWSVVALNGRNGRTVMPDPGPVMTLTFTDGLLRGNSTCNAISGTYLQGGRDGRDLLFPRGRLSTTLVGCSGEPPLLSRLSHVRHVSGAPGVRYLRSAIGMVIVELRRD